ncbi:MAG: dihydrolipoyl dehydrogenase [Pelovirga sp.]
MAKKIVIIGAGPGGYVAAIRAAQLGADVHLVEQGAMGGTCLNVGCVPTKAMLHVAELYQTLGKGGNLGIRAQNISLDWLTVLRYQKNLVQRLVKGVEGLLKANKVHVHRGQARLKSCSEVEIGGEAIGADAIVLAVGSEPARLAFPGADLAGVIDSTAALNLQQPPASLIVVGGGVIGVELASLYRGFGAEVTIVELLPQILTGLDSDIVSLVHDDLQRNGIRIMTGARLEEVRTHGSNLRTRIVQDSQEQEIAAEQVLVAVGRRPRTAGLGLENLGIAMERDRILVDEHFLTSCPQVYAIGDCSSKIMLAHVASAQGVAAVEHALGHKADYHGETVPACIYIQPEIASVGLTEEQARQQGLSIQVGRFSLSGNAKALIESEGKGLIKIISGGRYREVLGVHIWGPRATDLIAEAALALRLEATVDELISTIHAHPTIAEAVPEAALATDGMAIHWPPGLK